MPTTIQGYAGLKYTGTSKLKSAAEAILQGSEGADRELMDHYRMLFAQRSEGIAGAYRLQQEQAANQALAQGVSPDLAQRSISGARSDAVRARGDAKAGAQAGLAHDRSELIKGTASEIATLGKESANIALQKQAAKKAQQNALISAGAAIVGTVVTGGLAGGALAGGAAAALQKKPGANQFDTGPSNLAQPGAQGGPFYGQPSYLPQPGYPQQYKPKSAYDQYWNP